MVENLVESNTGSVEKGGKAGNFGTYREVIDSEKRVKLCLGNKEGEKTRDFFAQEEGKVSVVPLETHHLFAGVNSKVKKIKDEYSEQMSGEIEAGEEPEKIVQEAKKEFYPKEHATFEEEIDVLEILTKAINKFESSRIDILKNSRAVLEQLASVLGNPEEFDETVFVVPKGSEKEFKDALKDVSTPLASPVQPGINEKKASAGIDISGFISKDAGFDVILNGKRFLFLYRELNKDEVNKEKIKEKPTQNLGPESSATTIH